MLNSSRNNSPPFERQKREERKKRRKTSLGQALSAWACCFRRCQCRPALDPDIKGLRESFIPFKLEVCVLAPMSLIFATSLPATSGHYTLLQCLSHVSQMLSSYPHLIPSGTVLRVRLGPSYSCLFPEMLYCTAVDYILDPFVFSLPGNLWHKWVTDPIRNCPTPLVETGLLGRSCNFRSWTFCALELEKPKRLFFVIYQT